MAVVFTVWSNYAAVEQNFAGRERIVRIQSHEWHQLLGKSIYGPGQVVSCESGMSQIKWADNIGLALKKFVVGGPGQISETVSDENR